MNFIVIIHIAIIFKEKVSGKRKMPKWFYRLFYLFYPISILLCALVASLVS